MTLSDLNFGNTVNDPLFLFWTVVIYLIFIFHSWRIKEIQEDIKGAEILFLSGALGYIFFLLSKVLILPIIQLIPQWLQMLNSAIHKFIPTFIFGLYFVFANILIYYVLFIIITLSIISIIQYCLDPKKEIFRDYDRFNILNKIIILLKLEIPLILLFLVMIFLFSSVAMYYIADLKSISMDFWKIMNLVYSVSTITILLMLLIVPCNALYFTLRKHSNLIPIIFDSIKKIVIYMQQFLEERIIYSKNRILSQLFLFFVIVSGLTQFLIQANEGNLSWFLLTVLIVIIAGVIFLAMKRKSP